MALLLKNDDEGCPTFDDQKIDYSSIIKGFNAEVTLTDSSLGTRSFKNDKTNGILCFEISKESLERIIHYNTSENNIIGLRFIPGIQNNELVLIATPFLDTADKDEVFLQIEAPEQAGILLAACCPQPGGSTFVKNTKLATLIFP